MNLKDRAIMDDFHAQQGEFEKLGRVVGERLKAITKELDVRTLAVEYRVKKEDSLAGKLYRKGDKYQSLEDLTDILGCRVICYFTDDVDRMCAAVEEEFSVDWENSENKRGLLSVNSFGYLSVHYICSLRPEKGYPDYLCNKRFEIQLRTGLQHIWAAINHDIGYKSRFGVPAAITREFSRLAGLLELADEEFVRVRETMSGYVSSVHEKIAANEAQDVALDAISMQEYVRYNEPMQAFIKRLSEIEHSEILDVDAGGFVPALVELGITELGGVQTMLEENEELAYRLAYRILNGSELDILTSSTAIRFLLQAYLLNHHCDEDTMAKCFELSGSDAKRVHAMAKRLMKTYEAIKQ